MNRDAPIFVVELKALEALWIPSSWVHLVLSLEDAQQVCFNFIPYELLPRAIIQWRHERKMVHAKSHCVPPCQCHPVHGPLHFPTVVAQHMCSRPPTSPSAAQIVRDFLIEESRDRVWCSFCLSCQSFSSTLEWLASLIAANNQIFGKRVLKRQRKAGL